MKAQEPITKEIEGRPLNELRENIISKLCEFMDYCKVHSTGSKHSLMGPAGKLLNLIKTPGEIDWGKVKGYIANVIRMNQNWVPPQALELLDEACNILEKIKSNIKSPIQWLNIIDGIDYELFFRLFKEDRIQRDKFVTSEFRQFLQDKYKTIDEVNKISQIKYQKFEEISHPRDFSPADEINVVEEFWKYYDKKKKEKKKE